MADEVLGFPAMVRTYAGEFDDTVVVEEADLADAITAAEADCFAMNSLNPLITTERMTILVDDQLMAPSNAALALMASTIATPEAVGALDAIAASLTTERLNQMLNEIVANGTDPVVVANAFVDTL
jgi:glycine betaine/choline ABC-type transport system substrate-binding protein